MMDEQVRAFDEAVAVASLACERATLGNATKQAKAVRPKRRAPNRRAVRPIRPPSVGSAPGRDLALDGSFDRESDDAWLRAKLMTLVSPRRMHSSVSHDRRSRRLWEATLLPGRLPPTIRPCPKSREIRRNIAQIVRPIQRGTSRSVNESRRPRYGLRAGRRAKMLKGDSMLTARLGLADRLA